MCGKESIYSLLFSANGIFAVQRIMLVSAEVQRGRELAEMVVSTLQRMPNVQAVSEQVSQAIDFGVDFVVDASINGQQVRLMVQAKNSVFPRDVRAAFWQLKSASRPIGSFNGSVHVIPMIAAGTISDGAKELLQAERIGYWDRSGSLFLASHHLFVLIDKPATKAAQKVDRPLFSGNRSAVIHALLLHPEKWFSTNELAALAVVSPSTASVAFSELQRRDLVAEQGKGPNKTRKLSQPGKLLDEWAKQTALRNPRIRRYYVPMVLPEELMMRINHVCKKHSTAYVISHEWAAQLYSPFLSNISQVKAREVEEGSNLGVIESDSIRDMLFGQEIRGVQVQSPILAYLDLLDGEGRSKELAEHLRHERIRF
jgi:hypothetical protein